jgi:hypothetical protein
MYDTHEGTPVAEKAPVHGHNHLRATPPLQKTLRAFPFAMIVNRFGGAQLPRGSGEPACIAITTSIVAWVGLYLRENL